MLDDHHPEDDDDRRDRFSDALIMVAGVASLLIIFYLEGAQRWDWPT